MFRISALLTRRRYTTDPLSLRRLISTNPPPSFDHTLSHPIYTIWGSNTGVGKTLVSTGLASSFLSLHPSSSSKFIYIKPVQTGFPSDSDASFVYNKFSQFFNQSQFKSQSTVFASNHTLNTSIQAELDVLGGVYEARKLGIESGGDQAAAAAYSELVCKTMYGWKEAVSPHLAAEREGGLVSDPELLGLLKKCLEIGLEGSKVGSVLSVVETAGGVASPGPSGSLQCDLYRPFRLPCILVGDGRLGGISATISAYESLRLRGYDVTAVILEDHGLTNEVPLLSYMRNRVPVLVLPPVPKDPSDNLMEWFNEAQGTFGSLQEIMFSSFRERVQKLHEMPKKAQDIFWWPFTQHKLVPRDTIQVIDSRCGENFSVHKKENQDSITQLFDACASWWTQGPDSTLQIELARDMGYTAARFGHVMFPENVYEPALECAELLLEGVGKGWASRTYFSDNGSTAIEIALKMAFRKFLFDNEMLLDLSRANTDERTIELEFEASGYHSVSPISGMSYPSHSLSVSLRSVLALRGSYHGDTLGAMEAQAPSSYTGFLQQPWYTGRGFFLDPPFVFLSSGTWKLSLPMKMQLRNVNLNDTSFSLRNDIFSEGRDGSHLASIYSSYISQELLVHSRSRKSIHVGALIVEPVIQGAGGMQMVDPLFQRLLVKECRRQKIPVIFDEVFTGFWRLGAESASELLRCQPDIACFAKLMTGGIIPLAATLATDAVFESFVGDSKLQALLHGHSYTAHAMGCAAASKSIKWFKDPETNPNFTSDERSLRELWDTELVHQISHLQSVKRVVALGTLFALELQADGSNAGYASLYATSLLRKLREDGIYMRPLGNVVYLMCGPCTSPQTCKLILEKLYKRLEEFSEEKKLKTQELKEK